MATTPLPSSCPLCGGAAGKAAFPYATRWNGRRFSYVACRRCGSSFVTPLPGAADFDAMYDTGSYHDIHYGDVAETAEIRGALEFLAARAPAGRLLDFGAGNGAFLLAASRRGYAAQGVEQGPTSIELARRNAGVAVTALAAVERSGDRFDIIHIADVLEHLPDPAAILRRLETLLRPGGMFFVEGPLERQRSLVYQLASALQAARRRLGRARDGDFPPYHLTATDWRGQSHFFEKVMGYAVRDRMLYETGWPYPATLERGASLGRNARAVVGRAAVAFAATRLGERLGYANRFRAIVQPIAAGQES